MSHFTGGGLALIHWDYGKGRPLYRLAADLTLHIGYEGSGLSLTARKGFETDLGSDPTGVLDMVGIAPAAARAFVIHDLLCENALFTRLEADAIFLIAMEADGVPEAWRELIFAAVRTNKSRARHNPDELVFEVEMPPY